jgi:hypothetical protein
MKDRPIATFPISSFSYYVPKEHFQIELYKGDSEFFKMNFYHILDTFKDLSGKLNLLDWLRIIFFSLISRKQAFWTVQDRLLSETRHSAYNC